MEKEFYYPTSRDLRIFVEVVQESKHPTARYLPDTGEFWLSEVSQCIEYVAAAAQYEPCDFHECCARLLYKIVKRHELGDGNKRSAVIAVFVFCILNEYYLVDPQALKEQATRVAKTKGRTNEDLIRGRIAEEFRVNIRQ